MNYVAVRIATLRFNDPLPFDIFVKIGDRFVLYIRKGDIADGERLLKIADKGFDRMWIKDSDENTFLTYLENEITRLDDPDVPMKIKGEFASDAMITLAENIGRHLVTTESYFRVRGKVSKLISFLTSQGGALQAVLEASGMSLDDYQHAANVANLGLTLAETLRITKTETLLDMGLAALVHDIGHRNLSFDPSQDPDTLPTDQREEYEKHPEESVKLLKGKPSVSEAMLDWILNHEEVGTGGGFPSKKNIKDLPEEARILNLVNDYDRFCRIKKLHPLQAMAEYFPSRIGLFDLEHMKVLRDILKGS